MTGQGGDPRLPGSALDPWLLLRAPFSPPPLFTALPQTSRNSGVSRQQGPLPVIVPVGTLLKVTKQVLQFQLELTEPDVLLYQLLLQPPDLILLPEEHPEELGWSKGVRERAGCIITIGFCSCNVWGD